jgi:hypothetical protein
MLTRWWYSEAVEHGTLPIPDAPAEAPLNVWLKPLTTLARKPENSACEWPLHLTLPRPFFRPTHMVCHAYPTLPASHDHPADPNPSTPSAQRSYRGQRQGTGQQRRPLRPDPLRVGRRQSSLGPRLRLRRCQRPAARPRRQTRAARPRHGSSSLR